MVKKQETRKIMTGTRGLIVTMTLLLLIAACSKEPAPAERTTTAPESAPSDTTGAADEILTDLGKVFGMSGTFKCTAKMESVTSTMYVKDGKIRNEANAQGASVVSIMSGDDIWTITGSQCIHMRLSEIQAMAKQAGAQANAPKAQSKDDMARSAVDVKCERTTVPDSMFTPPSGCIEFSDMMKQYQVPSGFNVPDMS